eukprot:7657279-Pyramimonas_sp.AAC.1
MRERETERARANGEEGAQERRAEASRSETLEGKMFVAAPSCAFARGLSGCAEGAHGRRDVFLDVRDRCRSE